MAMMKLFFSIFPRLKGMAELAAAFEAKPFPNAGKILKTTVKVGSVRYRKCASIFIDEKGFYLGAKYIFRAYPTIFIPWSAVKEVRKERLYGLKATQFSFNDSDTPPVIIYEKDVKKFDVKGGMGAGLLTSDQ